jgi:hypothetical protein
LLRIGTVVMMLSRLLLHAAILIVCTLALRGQSCSMEVRAFDIIGHAIHEAKFAVGQSAVWWEVDKLKDLPCGGHAIRVDAPGFQRAELKVVLKEGKNLVITSLEVGRIAPPLRGLVMPGRILDFERFQGCHWLRFVPVLSPEGLVNSWVSERGGFGLEDPVPGLYSVYLLSEKGVCGWASIQIGPRNTIELKLEDRRTPPGGMP